MDPLTISVLISIALWSSLAVLCWLSRVRLVKLAYGPELLGSDGLADLGLGFVSPAWERWCLGVESAPLPAPLECPPPPPHEPQPLKEGEKPEERSPPPLPKSTPSLPPAAVKHPQAEKPSVEAVPHTSFVSLVARPVKLVCPETMAVGQSAPFEVHFPARPKELKGAERAGGPLLVFETEEAEPRVEVQRLAADFDVRPEGGKQIVRLRRGRTAKAIFNISPSTEGEKTLDVLIRYGDELVGRVTRRISVSPYVLGSMTVSKLEVIKGVNATLGIVSFVMSLVFLVVGV